MNLAVGTLFVIPALANTFIRGLRLIMCVCKWDFQLQTLFADRAARQNLRREREINYGNMPLQHYSNPAGMGHEGSNFNLSEICDHCTIATQCGCCHQKLARNRNAALFSIGIALSCQQGWNIMSYETRCQFPTPYLVLCVVQLRESFACAWKCIETTFAHSK